MKRKCTLWIMSMFFVSTTLLSCSEDDQAEACRDTEISMKINGELHTYHNSGTGIDMIWGTGGHELTLWFDRAGSASENMILKMRYKKTGHNVIDALMLDRFDANHTGGYNLINDDFKTYVKINRPTCFYATFSGKFIADGEEMTVTDGIISVTYDEPFSE